MKLQRNFCSVKVLLMNKYSGRASGFTLIEVLLALSVFAMAGIALLNTSDSHLRHLSVLENQMYAQWIAADQLVDVNLSANWPPKNNAKGQVDLAGREWHWLQKVRKTEDSGLVEITVEVRRQESDTQALALLSTFVSKSGNN
jgi:general secretion pathway protein I